MQAAQTTTVGNWLSKLWHIYLGEDYAAMKKIETVLNGHGLHMVGKQEPTFVCFCVHESAPAHQKPAALAEQRKGRQVGTEGRREGRFY